MGEVLILETWPWRKRRKGPCRG